MAAVGQVLTNQRLFTIERELARKLDCMERIPLVFTSQAEAAEKQKLELLSCMKIGQRLKRCFKRRGLVVGNELKQKLVGLKYRAEAINGGWDPAEKLDGSLLSELITAAGNWKFVHPLNPHKTLSPRDLNKIKEIARYPKFARLLLSDAAFQEKFFNWIIRDNNGVRQYVEFPAACARLEDVSLACRIGRFGGEALTLEKKKLTQDSGATTEKLLQLPFFNGRETQLISILDEDRIVVLNGNEQLSIRKIFEIFKAKAEQPGDVEFFGAQGITNWNLHEHGSWNSVKGNYERIDLLQEEWWKQLPPYEFLTKEQIKERFKLSLEQGQWLAVAIGSRLVPTVNLEDSHGYLEIAMPLADGRYQIFNFGKFSARYPITTFELLSFLTDTVLGKIAYPDENPFYSWRQHAKFPIVLTAQQGRLLMENLRYEFAKARTNQIIFQFSGENCAFWVQWLLQRLVAHRVPNLFKIYLLDVYPSNPVLGKTFSIFRRAPKMFQGAIIRVFDRCLGSHRALAVKEKGMLIFKSLLTTPSRTESSIFAPALLHHQIEKGLLPGIISFGH